MLLSRFPRIRLAHLPTPLEALPRLSKHLGGPKLYVKRDDCTGLGTGGNKTRKLEFLMAEALRDKADTILTQGAVQSNHARQTAAAAARLGMACELLFENRVEDPGQAYLKSGNVLLDRLFDARLHHYAKGTDMDRAMADRASELTARGKRPYMIPGGGSNRVGALGYVNCALELVAQANDHGLSIDHLVHATGSAGTQAGLIAGLKAMHSGIPVLGISVEKSRERQEEHVYALACETAEFLGAGDCVQRDDVVANDGYVGAGYGLPTDSMREALLLLARLEGILADPVYTGKALAGLIDLIRQGRFTPEQHVVFLHTGGAAGLFGYPEQLL